MKRLRSMSCDGGSRTQLLECQSLSNSTNAATFERPLPKNLSARVAKYTSIMTSMAEGDTTIRWFEVVHAGRARSAVTVSYHDAVSIGLLDPGEPIMVI